MRKEDTMSDHALTKSDGRALARSAQSTPAPHAPRVVPPCDIYESQDEVLVVADLPGVSAESLEIHLEGGELTVIGRRDVRLDQGAVVGTEYRSCEFERRFTVPGGIDAERIHAELKHGVLVLHLPKSEALRPRRIEVKSG
jgi:HSP20 family molecular chaperone IbpA